MEQEIKIIARDLMKTLKANNYPITSSLNIPSKLNMLIYNIFSIDANVLRNISAVCYKFRLFLTSKMKNEMVNDGSVRSRLLEATVAILFSACRHIFESVANTNSATSQLIQVLEQRLAIMSSRRKKFSPFSAGDEIRVRMCHIMYGYLQRYLRLCIRRVNVCLRLLGSTGLASKRMTAAPEMVEGAGSNRVSSFEVKYDFSMLYKLLSFQAKNISLLSDLAFPAIESTIAALAAFVNNAKLPISHKNQKTTIPLVDNEIVLPEPVDGDDNIHVNWNFTVLNELCQILTQYSTWFSQQQGKKIEIEKLQRVCRTVAGVTATCLKTMGMVDEAKVNIFLECTTEAKDNIATHLAQNILNDTIKPHILRLKEKITKRQKHDDTFVGSILASTTEVGSLARAAKIFVHGFKDYFHDPEDFWGACALFPPNGEGTELEGWAKAYKNSQVVLEDFSDVSMENNSPMEGLLVPPDFALAHLNNNKIISNGNNNTIRGSNGYDIKTRDSSPLTWWRSASETHGEKGSGLQSEGSIKYLMPVEGVTISIPGRDKLRKARLLKNELKGNNTSMSYTRPVFDVQSQTNNHFETPRLVLLPRQHQWACNSGGDGSGAAAVSAAVWNLPSIKLLYHELTLKEENSESQVPETINVDDMDINRAIGDIQSCFKEEFAASSNNNNNNNPSVLATTIRTLLLKQNNIKETEDNKYNAIDELALAPALLRRAGNAPFKPAASKACAMFVAPGNRRGRNNDNKNSKSPWWTSDMTLRKTAETAAEKLRVLTPSLLNIHPPKEQQSIKNFA